MNMKTLRKHDTKTLRPLSWKRFMALALFAAAMLMGLTASGGVRQQNFLKETVLAVSSAKAGNAPPAGIEKYAQLPLYFEKNQGQTAADIHYLSRAAGYTLYLTPTDTRVTLHHRQDKTRQDTTIKTRLVGAGLPLAFQGRKQLPGRINYLLGRDTSRWITKVPTYAEVMAEQVYPGIDLRYHSDRQQLEYDFIVAPGARADSIKLRFEGIKKLALNDAGDLLLDTGNGILHHKKPVIYQDINGKRFDIDGRYAFHDSAAAISTATAGIPDVGFVIAAYDSAYPLIIDPVLDYAGYLGGEADDRGLAITVDDSGSAYVAGTTLSAAFPTAAPYQNTLYGSRDAFIAKLNPAGDELVYATYLGGSGDDGEDENDDGEDEAGEDDNDDNDDGDSDNDIGMDIAVDSSGHLYITGTTNSEIDFPIVNAVQTNYGGGGSDAYIAKLSPDGSSLIFSSFLGGNNKDKGFGIALDAVANLYVTGMTRSTDFPVLNAAQASRGGGKDAYIVKLSSDGSRIDYATYIGGGKADTGKSIAVDSQGYATVTGVTQSKNDFPLQNALQPGFGGKRDAFITQLSSDGSSINFSTYLGGDKKDKGLGIAIDSQDNVIVVGLTKSKTGFPLVNALQSAYGGGSDDGFISKLAGDGSALLFSTYLGGEKTDTLRNVAVDNQDNLYVVGTTKSTTGIPTTDAVQSQLSGSKRDAVITQLSHDGSSVIFGSYFGGSQNDRGRDIAVNGQDVYMTGITRSDLDFPVHNALQAVFGGGSRDAFIVKMGPDNASPEIISTPITTAAVGQTYHYDVEATDPDDETLLYTLQAFPAGMLIDPDTGAISWTPDTAGDVEVTVAVDDNNGNTDIQSFTLTVIPDAVPPTITVTSPAGGGLTNNPLVTVTGNLDEAATLTINGQIVTVNPDLSFSQTLTLANQGANVLALTAVDSAGNAASATLTVVLDSVSPVVTLTHPAGADSFTNQDQLTLTGQLSEAAALTFNGVSVPVNADAGFSIGPLTLLEGRNSFTLSAVDSAGNAVVQPVNVTLDTVVPVLTVDSPQNNTLTNQAEVFFSGSVTEPAALTIQGWTTAQNPDNSFSASIPLNEGLNNVAVIATDAAGNADTATLDVTVDTTSPALDTGLVNRGNPQNQIVMVAGLPGAAEPGVLVHVINPVNGFVARALAQSDGSFSTDVAGFANDSFTLYAEDAAGNRSANETLAPNTPLSLTLNPIGNKIAPLGQTTRFTVTANDNQGHPVTLGLTPLPLPEGMEYNITTGEFSFRPGNGQEGDYDLTFSALNGNERVTETMTVTVPAPNPADPTVLTGRILDASSMQEGIIVPIVGVTVSFLATGVSTITDAEGFFTLTGLPGDAEVFDIDTSTAQAGPGGSIYASFREKFPLVSNVVNLVERPFYMPRLSAESLTQVNPAATTVVNNPTLGIGLSITAGNAVNDADGTPFTGQVSISEVPRNLAPANLPAFIDPKLLFTIQPVGVSYATPAPVTLANTEGHAPGSEVDIWSVDPKLGQFVIVGIGQVTADGSEIVTISGGIRANDWHAIVPPDPAPDPDGAPDPDPDQPTPCCPESDGSSMFSLHDGHMSTRFTLPAYRSLEASRALTFSYRTFRAFPKPVIGFNGQISVRSTVPDTVSYELEVAGLKQGKEVFIDTSGFSEALDESFRTAITFDASDFDSGIYDYRLKVTSNFTASTRRSRFIDGRIMVENETRSPFGAGWMLNGLYRLAFNEEGSVTLLSPAGNSSNYRPGDIPDEFISPDSNFAVFVRNPDGSYTHTEKDGVKMHFDAEGLLIAHEDRNHNTTAYAYDSEGKLTTITDPVGLVTALTYDSNNLLATVTDPGNRSSHFEYDATGNLIKIIYPDGTFEAFEYDNRHLMTAHEDERQNRFTDRYDVFGRIIEGTLPDGTLRMAQGKTAKGLIDVSSGIGTAENPAAVIRNTEVDGDYIDGRGNPSSKQLDAHGRSLVTIDEVGRVTEHQRDADSNPIRTIRPIGSVVTRTFDDFGNVLTQKEEFNGATTAYRYDNFSLVTQVTNPRNHSTTINRDPANGNPLSIVNHLLHTTTMEYDSRGLLTRKVSPNGLETVYTYNAQGLMDTKTETPPAGSPGNIRLWTYSYFPTGLLQTVNTPDGITLNYRYDDRSYLTGVSDNLNQRIVYRYDAHKNVTKTETLSSDGSLALLVDSLYDSRNRLTETRAPHIQVNGETTEESITQRLLDENSNLIGLIDPNGNSAGNSYDPYNRLATNTHRENGITEYTYDDQDRIIQVTAPNGVVTKYEYDIISRRTQEISPDRGTIRYIYDLANNVTTITEGRGITATMSYDELERVKTKSYPNTIPGKNENVTYTYDTCAFGLGFLCERTDESGRYAYDYDAYGNMTQGTFTEIEGTVYTMAYIYDDGDHVIQATYPSGRTVDYTRDGVRRIAAIDTTVNGNVRNIVSNLQYRGDNQMTQCSYGNGLNDSRSYDLQGRLKTQQLGTAANTLIDQRSYRYDKNSNIIHIETNTEDNGYQYDKRDRIIQDAIDADTPINFSYDLNDNRLTKILQDQTLEDFLAYQTDSNKISVVETIQTGTAPIENAANRDLIYNDAGRLFQLIEEGSLKAEYLYNDQGQRTRKTVYQADGISVAGITIYHYDHMGYLITETAETGQLIKDYIWQEGMHPVAQIDNTTGTEQILYLYTDHLMTNRLATDQNQAVVWRWEGEAFGNTPAQELAGFSVNLRFPGQYFDAETNLHYNYYRYYDPTTGRYITSDPIGLDGGLNTYGYALQNPVRYTDPSGLFVDEAAVQAAMQGIATATGVAVSTVASAAAGVAALVYPSPAGEGSDVVPEEDCPKNSNCDLKLDVALTSFSKKKPGNSYSCVYRKKGAMFSFPQWKGKECYPINYSTCMVDTATLDPALYGK